MVNEEIVQDRVPELNTTEQEALYPPLTYLRCLEMQMETVCGEQLLVATVEPVMA